MLHRVENTILSLGKDLVYNINHGNVLAAKHVSLAVTLKSLYGSKKLVTLLNKFGHGISDHMHNTYETALAELQAKKNSLLPSNT